MKQNPILITGGTGTVGSRIASRLIELGHRVRIASRKKGALADAEYVYFNWKDASSFTPALEQVKDIYLVAPVGVFDPAPYVLPFLKEAKRLGAKRVVMQSASVVSEERSRVWRASPGSARVSRMDGAAALILYAKFHQCPASHVYSNGGPHHNGFG